MAATRVSGRLSRALPVRRTSRVLLLLPTVEGCGIYVIAHLAHIPRADDVAALIAVLLIPLNAAVMNPILSTALALLYFRARQANGEDVNLSSVISTGVLPRSRSPSAGTCRRFEPAFSIVSDGHCRHESEVDRKAVAKRP